jgi:hypothetical protein
MDRRAFVSTVALGLLAALSVAQDRRQWDLVDAAGLVIRGFPCAPPSRARSHPRPCTDGRPRGELQVRNASLERTSAPATVRQTRVHAAPLLSPRGPRAVPVGPPPEAIPAVPGLWPQGRSSGRSRKHPRRAPMAARISGVGNPAASRHSRCEPRHVPDSCRAMPQGDARVPSGGDCAVEAMI